MKALDTLLFIFNLTYFNRTLLVIITKFFSVYRYMSLLTINRALYNIFTLILLFHAQNYLPVINNLHI